MTRNVRRGVRSVTPEWFEVVQFLARSGSRVAAT
jgi:hypothetical protein